MAHTRHRLLVVDDEQDIRELLALELGAAGFAADTAKSGNEALRRLAAEHYDAVVSDVNMPDGGGFEVLDAVRSRAAADGPGPVIMMVSGLMHSVLEDALRRGADGVYAKPIDGDALIEGLRRALTPRDLRWAKESERQALRLTIEYHVAQDAGAAKRTSLAETINIGRGGMCVIGRGSARMPEPGSLVGFKVHLDGQKPAVFEGYGRVRWARAQTQSSFGVEFLYLDEQGLAVVAQLG